MATQNIIRERLDSGGFSPVMALVVGIGFILNLVDGFDVIAMSVAAPALTAEWGNINDKQLGWILSSALFGMAIGAAVVAPYADRLGRRIMLLASTILIGICMVGTGITPRSVEILIILRFFTGLGVGVILASGAAIASEFAPEKYRNLAVAIAITGLSIWRIAGRAGCSARYSHLWLGNAVYRRRGDDLAHRPICIHCFARIH